MNVIPAIDVRGGLAVRLTEGDFSREKVYSNDPVQVAREHAEAGAQRLHVVDLDAARGEGDSRDVVRSIMKAVKVEVQIAGGVRTRKEAQEWLDAGAVAVVMGTAAVRDPLTFHSTVWAQPGRVLAALDVKEGLPAVTGWTDTESVELETLLARCATLPLGGVVLTAVEGDGTLSGPDLETLKRVRSRTVLPLSYSGGIRSLDDLRALAEAGADAVIVGKALYEGQIDLKAALALV